MFGLGFRPLLRSNDY
uniref:Uncharacterized protein n=1 Tax=Anguilla anguilla TaxID=7936 RepID=A0A0E9TDE4_ANGAN